LENAEQKTIENTDNTQTKHNPQVANDAKQNCSVALYSTWDRKRGGLILQCSEAHMGRFLHRGEEVEKQRGNGN